MNVAAWAALLTIGHPRGMAAAKLHVMSIKMTRYHSPSPRRRSPAACLLQSAVAGTALAFISGCARPLQQQALQTPRPLTIAEMDGITVGNATVTSNGAALALGAQASSSTFSKDLSVGGGGPTAGSPFVNYAMSQTKSLARGTLIAHAKATGKAAVSGDSGSGVGAAISARANGAPPMPQAAAALQVFAVSLANGTHLLFGSVSASACCVPGATTTVSLDLTAQGRYLRVQQNRPTNVEPGSRNAAIDFALVSSSLPITDPSRIMAGMAAAHF